VTIAILKSVGTAAVASLAVASLGTLTWVPLLVANTVLTPQIPWSIPVEALALVLIWLFLDGRGWPRSTSLLRHQLLRARIVPIRVFLLAWLAGGLALLGLAGLWVVLVELTGVGGNPTLAAADQFPTALVTLAIVMGSLVSPLTEEAAFRGYGQVLLERGLRPVAAIALSSAYFALYHGPTQGFAPSKLLFYLTVGVVFGTIAFLTQSVLPAIPVHIAGDLLFFLVIWPNDSGRRHVLSGGPDAAFWLSLLQLFIFGSLAALIFVWLARVRDNPAAYATRW
jgi:membrane protease YdiL (CAAX protease family)